MGGKLVFAWPSDPLLLYALSLAAILFSGILLLMFTIIFKHGSRLKSEKIQTKFVASIQSAIELSQKNANIQTEIAKINSLIASHKKDVAYGWVRLLEKTPKSDRTKYVAIAGQTNMIHCIPHCLNEEGLAEKCIALEAIGLSGFDQYINDVQKYVYQGGIAPYACIALSRLIGIAALPQIIQSYEKGTLSTTQALSAIVEIPKDLIVTYLQDPKNIPLPKQLYRYLGIT